MTPSNNTQYEFLEHTADIRLAAYGNDQSDLFINTLRGMMNYLFDQETFLVPTVNVKEFSIQATDIESLLVDFLSYTNFIITSEHKTCSGIQIFECSSTVIRGNFKLGKLEAVREIKAVTYNDIAVICNNNNWSATITFDI